MVLSLSYARDTFALLPALADEVADDKLLADILFLASEIAQRSAKHSAEFLQNTPAVARLFSKFGDEKTIVADSVLTLATQFADRTGGLTSDLWLCLPDSLSALPAVHIVLLMGQAVAFLEYGGTVPLHFVTSGH